MGLLKCFSIFYSIFFLSFMLHKMHLKIFNLMTKTEMKNMWAFFHHLNTKKKPAFFFFLYWNYNSTCLQHIALQKKANKWNLNYNFSFNLCLNLNFLTPKEVLFKIDNISDMFSRLSIRLWNLSPVVLREHRMYDYVLRINKDAVLLLLFFSFLFFFPCFIF